METTTKLILLPLFLVSVLAFIVPIFTSWFSRVTRIPVPAVVGEIIVGIIIGKSVLAIIPDTESIPWLDFLSLFGFTYLMFLSGLEIDFGLITVKKQNSKLASDNRPIQNQPIVIAFGSFLITIFLAGVVSLILKEQGYINSWLFMTLILSTTSVSIVVPMLKEKGISRTLFGQTILLSALTADFLTMLLITLFVAFSKEELIGRTILITFILGISIFVLYRIHLSNTFDKLILKLSFIKPLFQGLIHSTSQIKVRGSIALMVTFIALSQYLGFEVILGAFLAGILVTLILGESKTSELEMKLDAIGYGFFIPIFFISVGINVDLNIILQYTSVWTLLAYLIIAAFAIKIIASSIFLLNYSIKETLSAGILLSSRLSLIIAAATIGYREGLILESVNTSIIIVAIFTCITAPIFFNKLLDYKKREPKKEKIVIVGANELARYLGRQLLNEKKSIIIAAYNSDEYIEARKAGLPVVQAGNNITETLTAINTDKARVLITTTEMDELNLQIALTAKANFGVEKVISLVNQAENMESFKENHIEPISKVVSSAEEIVNRLIIPDGISILTRQKEAINIADVWVTNENFDSKKLKDINLYGDTLIVHIKRGEEAIVPHGETVILLNDHLTLAGHSEFVEKTIDLLGVTPENYCPFVEHIET